MLFSRFVIGLTAISNYLGEKQSLPGLGVSFYYNIFDGLVISPSARKIILLAKVRFDRKY